MSGTLRIWDTTQLEHPLKIELKVLSGAILDIAWSADSQRIIVVGDGKVPLLLLHLILCQEAINNDCRSVLEQPCCGTLEQVLERSLVTPSPSSLWTSSPLVLSVLPLVLRTSKPTGIVFYYYFHYFYYYY